MLLVLAVAASPIESTPWWACLKREAVRLEVSGDRPRDVASAAIEQCRSDEPKMGDQLRVKVEDRIITKLAAEVVEARAARKR